MQHCDIALPVLDGARQLTRLHSPEDIISFYHDFGAGNCFDRVFLSNYLRDDDILNAAETANRGADLPTTGYGAIDPIPLKSTFEKPKEP